MINNLYSFYRYMIKIRVIDSSDSTTFVLFDRDATILFKKNLCWYVRHSW